MNNYVLGFMFDLSLGRVVMLRKERPSWQRGCWNGVGGRIEDNETTVQAMVREFKEETGVETSEVSWVRVCKVLFEEAEVHVFAAASDIYAHAVSTVTDEEIELHAVGLAFPVVENVPAMLALCQQRLKLDGDRVRR